MKPLFVLIFLPILAFKADDPSSRLNGAYQQVTYPTQPISNTSSQINKSITIRLFFGGHWAKLQYDEQLVNLEGGGYALKAGKAIQTTNYFKRSGFCRIY
jgi:hypothetical protein